MGNASSFCPCSLAIAPKMTICGVGPDCREQSSSAGAQADYKIFGRAYEAFTLHATPFSAVAQVDEPRHWVCLIVENQCKLVVPPLSRDQQLLLKRAIVEQCHTLEEGMESMVNGTKQHVAIRDGWKSIVIGRDSPIPFRRLSSIQLDTTWQSFDAILVFEPGQGGIHTMLTFSFNQMESRILFLLAVKVLRQLSKRRRSKEKRQKRPSKDSLGSRQVSSDVPDSNEGSERSVGTGVRRRSKSSSSQPGHDQRLMNIGLGKQYTPQVTPVKGSSMSSPLTDPSRKSPSKIGAGSLSSRSAGGREYLTPRGAESVAAVRARKEQLTASPTSATSRSSRRLMFHMNMADDAASEYSMSGSEFEDVTLSIGSRVCICGLNSMQHLNGQAGTCKFWDDEAERWHVQLYNGETKSVRIENLLSLDSACSSSQKLACIICLDAPAVMAFVPCGHQCICTACVEQLSMELRKKCPQCRQSSSDLIRIFS